MESGLEYYLEQIRNTPLLTPEQEKALSSKIIRAKQLSVDFLKRKRNTPEDIQTKEEAELAAQEARAVMIQSNLRLVVNIAKNFTNRGLPLSDLIEEGNIGLMRAVEGFDPSLNNRFSTYGSYWIKQAILRALINGGQPVHIPAYMVEMISKWRQIVDRYREQCGRDPSMGEIARELNIDEGKAGIIKQAIEAGRSRPQPSDQAGESFAETIPDKRTPSPEAQLVHQAEKEAIRKLLSRLNDREAKILRLRFGFDQPGEYTLKEIGAKLGLTRERVRQIENEALRKLHQVLSQE